MPKILHDGDTVHFECPGCGEAHTLNIDPSQGRPCWSFNGNADKPTISPSILAKSGHCASGKAPGNCWCDYEQRMGKPAPFTCHVCHSFVRDGSIEFLSDCTHHLAGKTVELPEVKDAC